MDVSSGLQKDFSSWVAATRDPSELRLGIEGFKYEDLYEPARLAALGEAFFAFFKQHDAAAFEAFEKYRACGGQGMTPEQTSDALLGASPALGQFLAQLFGVEASRLGQIASAKERDVLWHFKKDFAKKRLFKATAGKAWTAGAEDAARVAKAALQAAGAPEAELGTGADAEEISVARATLRLFELDDTARKAAKAGGVKWTDELHAFARSIRSAISQAFGGSVTGPVGAAIATAAVTPTDEEDGRVAALALDAVEAWLQARRNDHHDAARRWPSLKAPQNIEHEKLVQLHRGDPRLPELFVGPEEERRARQGFELSDRRMTVREVESEVDYCLYCHDRAKDSCTRGLKDAKTGEIKKNPLGVELNGCPLDERISEMHYMRKFGDSIAALALVCIDNPMLPGTGHRICNDCMKACIFQKQDPVNIPQIETAVLTDVLEIPWGFEIYGLLTRWNPLDVKRPHIRPYNGKNVLIVGLGPAGYTLAHHLTAEGFACVGIDGLKIEPLPVELTGDEKRAPRPIKDFSEMYLELDERILLGFGGVSEYGITIRWDKNFLTVLYVTLARQRLLRMYGGVRFGGAVDLDSAWKLGFDHVAIAAGAGRPTIIPMKNNIARGIRKASDFLMALQLTGAYKRSSLANLQVRLPAIVIGGGLTAIDTATELLAYYIIQAEKTAERLDVLTAERGEGAVRKLFDDEEWGFITEQRQHAALIKAEREKAAKEGRKPQFQKLLDEWGGVSIVYRKRVIDSPAYRLNHEEVIKSLEEGVRYIENMAPLEAVVDERDHVRAMIFERQVQKDGKWVASGEKIELPARSVCVAAGTSPNVTYEREKPNSFKFDKWKQFFASHKATVGDDNTLVVEPAAPKEGFFTSYNDGKHAVSFYGDNHPHYAGSVVKAMASAKDAYPHVVSLFRHDIAKLDQEPQAARDARLKQLFTRLDDELVATVHDVVRLTPTIVELVVRAPAAAKNFEPGQFYRLQNFESTAHVAQGTRLTMEGIALTGAWVDKEKGLLSLIALEMGVSSRLIAALKKGERVIVMGPTGTPTEIPEGGKLVLLAGGGLGNAVLFSIAKALRAHGDKVLYFAGYKNGADVFKRDDIEVATDQVIWCSDMGIEIPPNRPQDRHFRGNIVQAMVAYAKGELGGEMFNLKDVSRIIAIGSDRMMNAVREARHGILAPHLDPGHVGIASINSPMQCMMKEVCAQCLQKHVDPKTGKETIIFSCFNQDQLIDHVDFKNLSSRLRANSAQEKIANMWFERVTANDPEFRRI
jgi:NADPH-dependent glutamate synthase beta subunit-like oxidoreductase/NAD(P)H-flavin reductase